MEAQSLRNAQAAKASVLATITEMLRTRHPVSTRTAHRSPASSAPSLSHRAATIRVEGHYGPAPGARGWLEIKTVYPAADVDSGTIPPVPGSQVSVPGGVVTPPDYGYGDD